MRFMSFMHIGCICMSFFKVHWALREKHKKMPNSQAILVAGAKWISEAGAPVMKSQTTQVL